MPMIGLGVFWYSVYNVVHKYISYITKKMHILLTKIGKHRHFPVFFFSTPINLPLNFLLTLKY